MADPEKLRQELANAGLKEVHVEPGTHRMEFQSGDHMWDCVTNSNPIGAMLVTDLTAEQRAAVRQTLDGMLRQSAGGNGPAVLTNAVNIGMGTK